MHKIYSNLEKLLNEYSEAKNLGEKEKGILDAYFSKGGLVKTNNSSKLSISYPNKSKVKADIELIKKDIANSNKEIKMWEKTKSDAETYVSKMKIYKFADPLYWKHIYKKYTDKDYRTHFDKTKIPLDLIADPKLRKIIVEFMNNKEYRENLSQTMESSLVYKNRSLGEQVIESLSIKKNIAEKKLAVLYKNKESMQNQIKAYEIISRWIVE